jgi:cyclic pyranopterin phosphate synthase
MSVPAVFNSAHIESWTKGCAGNGVASRFGKETNVSETLMQPWPQRAEVASLPLAPAAHLLRLSVTNHCNFRCRYCMPADGAPALAGAEPVPLLSFEELAANVNWLVQHTNVDRVKLTGGEPMVRAGLDELICKLKRNPGIREISMTTNGSLLAHKAEALKAAGLARVNVSLDSLDPQRFAELSRGGRLEETLAGVDAAVGAGLLPVKLNAVLQRSTWKRDVPQLLDYAAERGLEMRFIELMRTGTERAWSDSEFVSVAEVKQWLALESDAVEIATKAALPARLVAMQWRGTLLKIGWIGPRSTPFCGACERLRIDARGQVRRCLMDAETFDLAGLRRAQKSGDDENLREAFRAYMTHKHLPRAMDSESAMSAIGG